MQWQKNMLDDLLAMNEYGLWTHTKFAYSVPRRNGKNEIVLMKELFALMNREQKYYIQLIELTLGQVLGRD